MKRVSGDNIFSLECRMRKKATLDLGPQQKEENTNRLRQNICYNSDGIRIYTLETLPPWMFHIGDLTIASVSCFSGTTRIHIRKYVPDDFAGLHPTKEGISVSPEVWESLLQQLFSFSNHRDDKILIVKRDICLSRQSENNETLLCLQRLFQRKDYTLEFIPQRIVLNLGQLHKLDSCSDMIRTIWKEKLFTNSMRHFVHKEIGDSYYNDTHHVDEMQDYLERLRELMHGLTKCFKKHISAKISELSPCTACHGIYEFKPFSHTCEASSPEEKFINYFDKALYFLDWELLSKDFVSENISCPHFKRLVLSLNFFELLDVKNLFADVKAMYIEEPIG